MRNIIIPALLALLLPVLLVAQMYPRRHGATTATANSGPYNGPAVTFHGTLKALTKKELILDLDKTQSTGDQESLTIRFSKKTKFLDQDKEIKPADIAPGTHILVDATREGDLKLSALNVMVAPAAAKDGR